MKNPFLTLLEDPASLITIEFDKAEKEMIVRMLEEKVNNAIAAYDNPEQHDDAIYNPFNEWLYYLNEMWNGKLDYTFEQWAYTIGIQKYELYKMILGLLADKHLDYVCEHETNIDNDTLDELRINRGSMGKPINCTQQLNVTDLDDMAYTINDPNSKYDCEGKLDK